MTYFSGVHDFQTEAFSSESRTIAIADGLDRIAQGQNVCYELAEYRDEVLIQKVPFVDLDDEVLRDAAAERDMKPGTDVDACEHIIRNRERLSWHYRRRSEAVDSLLASQARREEEKRQYYQGLLGRLRKLRDACCRFCGCLCCSSGVCNGSGSTTTPSISLYGSFGAGGSCAAAAGGGGCGGGGGGGGC